MTSVLDLLPGAFSLVDLAASERDGIALERRCGAAVLLLSTDGLQKARVLSRTRTGEAHGAMAVAHSFYVVPVKNVVEDGARVVRVGRAASNDVVINDVTLSKLHAIFALSREGFLLEDAGSKNGTFVDDVAVPVRGEGSPRAVPSKSSLRFGSVRVQFLSTTDLRSFMKQLMSL